MNYYEHTHTGFNTPEWGHHVIITPVMSHSVRPGVLELGGQKDMKWSSRTGLEQLTQARGTSWTSKAAPMQIDRSTSAATISNTSAILL